ncbi:hypothetical protein BGM26_16820 [Bacillus sp. FJAT-29790]|uniref:hypothetical protein n=1 Tax=Bacillus sp. FJAT-29790 TaxID=1895002 RepID=UPI001C21B415|nr:hypothetical protein [Bacillus sp. FJAT-29790]MBU8880619.1 hypothetical protein [Bacillus sp. FJAT-29790]
MEVLRNYYAEVSDHLDTLDEREMYKILIEEIIMSCPSAHLGKEFNAFMETTDLDSRIDMIKEKFPSHWLKTFIRGYYLELKQYELSNI